MASHIVNNSQDYQLENYRLSHKQEGGRPQAPPKLLVGINLSNVLNFKFPRFDLNSETIRAELLVHQLDFSVGCKFFTRYREKQYAIYSERLFESLVVP